jgi:hypothetical protein
MTQDRLDRAIYVLDTLMRRELASDVREALTIVLEEVTRMRNKEAFSNYIGDTMATVNVPNIAMSNTEYTIQLVAGTDVHGPGDESQDAGIKYEVAESKDRGTENGDQGPRTDATITVTGVSGEGQT